MKVGAACLALAANVYCALVVIVRYRRRTNATEVDRLGWRVRASASLPSIG